MIGDRHNTVYNILICFFKQKTAYEMRISDWSSDVCSSDLAARLVLRPPRQLHIIFAVDQHARQRRAVELDRPAVARARDEQVGHHRLDAAHAETQAGLGIIAPELADHVSQRSEEHTSELQSLMRISYAVFCLKKKTKNKHKNKQDINT